MHEHSATRIRLRRTKGWRKPEGTIVVARPSKWGNPFIIASAIETGFASNVDDARELCVEAFRTWLAGEPTWEFQAGRERLAWMQEHLPDIKGRDLACWCPLDQPCHADVLLEAANGSGPR